MKRDYELISIRIGSSLSYDSKHFGELLGERTANVFVLIVFKTASTLEKMKGELEYSRWDVRALRPPLDSCCHAASS